MVNQQLQSKTFGMVTDIIDKNMKEHEAVFYTHAHEDHVGLFWYIPIDQYIWRRE